MSRTHTHKTREAHARKEIHMPSTPSPTLALARIVNEKYAIRPFGAPVTSREIQCAIDIFKGKDIVKSLKFKSRAQLERFARNEITRSELSPEQRAALKQYSAKGAEILGVETNKFWTRKLACSALGVLDSRKTRKPRARKNTDTPAVETTATA